MGRMTKFLKQHCMFEKAKCDSKGNTLLNDFGDVQYEEPVSVSCRRERVIRDVQTSDGAILRSASRYFLDEQVEIRADDRLDGRVVLEVEEYINQLGETEGWECYV